MPDPTTAYQRALLDARAVYREEMQPEAVRQLYLSYADAVERIARDVEGGRITPERARTLERQIMARLRTLAAQLGTTGDGAMVDAVEIAVAGHEEALSAAAQAAGRSPLSYSFAAVPERALALMAQRRGFAATFRTLINRRIEGMAADVERYLMSAVARGVSGRRGAQELAAILSRDDPALLEVLGQLGPRGGRTRAAIRAGVEIPDAELRQAKSLLSDSYRIMVHESNTAYHEADTQAMAESPVVRAVRWTLSGRHAGLPSSPDVCDVVAATDAQGLGPGTFAPGTSPTLLHPFCQCGLEPVLARPAEWGEPRPAPPASVRATSDAEARRVMAAAAGGRALTPRHVERQARIANDYRSRALDTYLELEPA